MTAEMRESELFLRFDSLGYTLSEKGKQLLITAFTHSSYANEQRVPSNERLEFLGDSILNFVIADYVYTTRALDEGKMTDFRKLYVSSQPLSNAIDMLNVAQFMRLGRGQAAAGANEKLKEDLFEAIVGCLYLDCGMDRTKEFIISSLVR